MAKENVDSSNLVKTDDKKKQVQQVIDASVIADIPLVC